MKFGGRDRDRTCDLMLAKHALSQLSYTPTAVTIIDFKAFATLSKLKHSLCTFSCVLVSELAYMGRPKKKWPRWRPRWRVTIYALEYTITLAG